MEVGGFARLGGWRFGERRVGNQDYGRQKAGGGVVGRGVGPWTRPTGSIRELCARGM